MSGNSGKRSSVEICWKLGGLQWGGWGDSREYRSMLLSAEKQRKPAWVAIVVLEVLETEQERSLQKAAQDIPWDY